MSIRMPTRAEIMRCAPKARKQYVDTFLNNEDLLRKAGILHHPLILCHLLAQTFAETNYWRIWEEDMNYRSADRIRQVWPARTRRMSQAKLMSLVSNPRGLANEMYGTRMGNRRGTDDGFMYRGRGYLQTTGRHAYQRYAKKLGVSLSQDIDEDYELSLQFAVLEWVESGCNSLAMENDILGISRAINVGSARSSVMPNGMEHRRRAFKRAWKIWGDPAAPKIPEVSGVTKKELRDLGSETLSASDLIKAGGIAGGVASGTAGVASESGLVETVPVVSANKVVEDMQSLTESVTVSESFVIAVKSFWVLLASNLWVIGVCLAVAAVYYGRKIDWRRLIDARLNKNIGRLADRPEIDDSLPLDPDDAVIPRA